MIRGIVAMQKITDITLSALALVLSPPKMSAIWEILTAIGAQVASIVTSSTSFAPGIQRVTPVSRMTPIITTG